jgi:hypothetical protein
MNKSRWKKKVWTLLKLKRTFNMILICKKDLNSFWRQLVRIEMDHWFLRWVTCSILIMNKSISI